MIPLAFVIETDQKLLEKDIPLHARPFHVVVEWMRQNGIGGGLMAPEIWTPLNAAYDQLYPSSKRYMPPMLLGGVGFRDRMYAARVNVGFGQFKIVFLECIDIPKHELEVIWRHRPAEVFRATYAVADLWDFAYGTEGLGRDLSSFHGQLWNNARSAITSAAQDLSRDHAFDLSVQSSCIAAELAMKGVLAYRGWPESEIRKLNHDLPKIAEAIIKEAPSSTDVRLMQACGVFPGYANSRYKQHGLSKIQLIELAMRAQYVAADVLRRVSQRNIGGDLENRGDLPPRGDLI
ncbi:hypothetical protein [Ensifer sp. MJa1]|uniref:hypothetical protein n=1 Tax=Ensifer sp. MJa1 TaxID=2919888 RepID=UPI0030084DE3